MEKYKAQGKIIIPSKRELNYIIDEKRLNDIFGEIDKLLPADQKDLLTQLKKQAAEYATFIKTELLPLAPEETVTPADVYTCMLKYYGVNEKPEEMISRAKADFDVWMEKYQALALSIAKEKGWTETNPAEIVARLKTESTLKDEEQIIEMYKTKQQEIENLIRLHQIVTLPKEPTIMRKGTPAEEAILSAPSVFAPPFIDADGSKWALFLLVNLKSFGNPIKSPSLMVHEGNPGHVLQVNRIIEMLLQGKLNYLETIVAVNSVNIEGWAHYMEYLMCEYFDAPAKLGALQDQLLRISRMFLDPQVNTGKATYQDVIKFLTEKLGLDQEEAKSEAERYSFLMPGQATAYRIGALKIMDLRKKLENEMGKKFHLQSFHDALLSFGTLPTEIVAEHIQERMTERNS